MTGQKVLIATPMYGGMCAGHYVVGLLGCINVLRNNGIAPYFAQITNESLIPRARNELARLFLDETDFTHLMFIDADIHFPDTAVYELIKADRDIVCGVYPKKEIDWGRIGQAAREGHDNLRDFGGAYVLNLVPGSADEKTDEQGLLEVRHGGTGFMLIKREVFEKLKPHVPTYRQSTVKNQNDEYIKPLTHEFFATSIDETGCLLSEDYHFCELWRKHGGKVYVNPFIHLEHLGTYIYTGNLLRGGSNLK